MLDSFDFTTNLHAFSSIEDLEVMVKVIHGLNCQKSVNNPRVALTFYFNVDPKRRYTRALVRLHRECCIQIRLQYLN